MGLLLATIHAGPLRVCVAAITGFDPRRSISNPDKLGGVVQAPPLCACGTSKNS